MVELKMERWLILESEGPEIIELILSDGLFKRRVRRRTQLGIYHVDFQREEVSASRGHIAVASASSRRRLEKEDTHQTWKIISQQCE